MRTRAYCAHPSIGDHWVLRCMSRCLSGGQSEARPQCLSPQASLVLIYRPTTVSIKGSALSAQTTISYGVSVQTTISYGVSVQTTNCAVATQPSSSSLDRGSELRGPSAITLVLLHREFYSFGIRE
ncbi:hypothetical protein TNCV_707251 [Trichonephila clavipes]|nr:hypothetical protein TNCV_707251 [Trichonephila clavipes]